MARICRGKIIYKVRHKVRTLFTDIILKSFFFEFSVNLKQFLENFVMSIIFGFVLFCFLMFFFYCYKLLNAAFPGVKVYNNSR